MATFDYLSVAQYTFDGTNLNLVSSPSSPQDLAGTLDDGDAGSTEFSNGELVDGTSTFEGVFPSGSDLVAVADGPNLLLFSPTSVADTTFPAQFAPGDLQNVDPGSPFTTCFASGTLIATPTGETAVEKLEIGDMVNTADGRTVPVKWVGRQTVHKVFTPAERFIPVRVSAGALGQGLPHSDLVLTAEHALVLEGLAINAGALVNGATITLEPIDSLPVRKTYFHIETQDHDVIMANGAAAETYVDYLQRQAFDNYAEYLELYGEERTIPEMSLPRISAARLVPSDLKNRLAVKKVA